MTWLEKIDTWRVLVAAVLLVVMGNAADIISSSVVMAFVPGVGESNPLMRDPATLRFLPLMAIEVKLILHAALIVFSASIFAGTRSWLLASLIWWWKSWGLLLATASNILLLIAP